MLIKRRLTEFDRTVSDKITGLTHCHLGTVKYLVCSFNILNRSDKHFLPFHDSFHGVEAHIHFDFHLEKYIFLITFTLGKVRKSMEKKGTTSVSSEVGSSVNGSAEKPHETVRTLRFSCLFYLTFC